MNTKGAKNSCQLVLQFRGDSREDLETAVEMEDELCKSLAGLADVDGHDVGSGEINIFVLTSNPKLAFQNAKPVLARFNRLTEVTAAIRNLDGQTYTVIWPEASQLPFKVK